MSIRINNLSNIECPRILASYSPDNINELDRIGNDGKIFLIQL